MGLFSKIKEGLFKTRGSVGQKMDQLVENSRALDDDFYDELSDILVMADVGVTTATEAVDELRERVTAEKITDAAKAKEIFKEILAARMRDKPMVLESPSVIFIIGVNGVGKTTSIGKLASRLKTVGRRVLIVAGDTFRAAAAEQLTVWADRADVPSSGAPRAPTPRAWCSTAFRPPARATRTCCLWTRRDGFTTRRT